jgi:NADH:ubiquinone oxidoreductase subunit C
MNGNTESIETEKSVRKKHESVRSSTGKNVPGMQTQVKESEPKTGPEEFTTQPHSQLQHPEPNVNPPSMAEDMKAVLLPGDLLSQYESSIEELSAMATFKHTIPKFISPFHTALTKIETLQKTILENTSTLTAMNTSQQREIKALKLLLATKDEVMERMIHERAEKEEMEVICDELGKNIIDLMVRLSGMDNENEALRKKVKRFEALYGNIEEAETLEDAMAMQEVC